MNSKDKKLNEMSLIDHLTELRKRLIWCFFYIIIVFIFCFYFADNLFSFLANPLVELFDKVSFSNRESFNYLIDQLSRPLIDSIDWWAQNPASRNTYTSPLYHYFCSYKFFQEILSKEIV